MAVKKGNKTIVDTFIKAGAELVSPRQTQTPLVCAIEAKKYDIAGMLFGLMKDRIISYQKYTQKEVENNFAAIVCVYEFVKKDPELIDLRTAIEREIIPMSAKIEFMPANKPSASKLIDLVFENGHTALTLAVSDSDKKMVDLLIDAGAKLIVPDQMKTPLICAIQCNQNDLITLKLFNLMKDIVLNNNKKYTPEEVRTHFKAVVDAYHGNLGPFIIQMQKFIIPQFANTVTTSFIIKLATENNANEVFQIPELRTIVLEYANLHDGTSLVLSNGMSFLNDYIFYDLKLASRYPDGINTPHDVAVFIQSHIQQNHSIL